MYLQLLRLRDNNESTIGTLHANGEFECFTLEDTHNEPKIFGKTRIPKGTYEIKLRTEGGMNGRYSQKYDFHEGMLWLQNVENFEWVYFHVGNDEDDTDGCILVGQVCSARDDQSISGSVLAYKALYKKIIVDLKNGVPCTLEVI